MTAKRLAIIPARGGSKGVPRKNIRLLGGKPLIAHTLETVRASGCFDKILVSTDDPEIAAESRRWGGEAPWLRPPELATDSAAVIDAVFHTLDRLDKELGYVPDIVALLQPTSPFRTTDSVREALRLLDRKSCEAVVSVSPARTHPYWCRRVTESGELEDFLSAVAPLKNRQELPAAYAYDGCLYARTLESLRRHHSFHGKPVVAWMTPPEEALDIDTPQDWEMAEFLFTRRAGAAA